MEGPLTWDYSGQMEAAVTFHEHNPHHDEDSYVRRGLRRPAPSRQCEDMLRGGSLTRVFAYSGSLPGENES